MDSAHTEEFISIETRHDSDFWFACVDIKVIQDRELTPVDKAVFAVICSFVRVDSRSYTLKMQTIADTAGCGMRTAQKSIKALADRGVIERIERHKNGKQLTCTYRIIGHRAKCYKEQTPEECAESRGANIAGYVKNCTPRGAESAHRLLEPRSYDNQDLKTPPYPPEGECNSLFEPEEAKQEEPENQNNPPEPTAEPKSGKKAAVASMVILDYNAILPELPQAAKATGSRIKAVSARIREDPARANPRWWREYFASVRQYPWLMGENPESGGWRADFDWLIKPTNMQKVLEGRYPKRADGARRVNPETEALQRKYTGEGGVVDVIAMLRNTT